MTAEMLLGYAGGFITLATIAGMPEHFRPSVTENPQVYLFVGVILGTIAFILDLVGVWF